MLLWIREDTLYYTMLDGSGNQIGKIYSMDGEISSCQPILASNGEVTWYKESTVYSWNVLMVTV